MNEIEEVVDEVRGDLGEGGEFVGVVGKGKDKYLVGGRRNEEWGRVRIGLDLVEKDKK